MNATRRGEYNDACAVERTSSSFFEADAKLRADYTMREAIASYGVYVQ
jgi:hypothetical protein